MPQEGSLVRTDADGVVLMVKQNIDYRRVVTELHAELPTDRFAKIAFEHCHRHGPKVNVTRKDSVCAFF